VGEDIVDVDIPIYTSIVKKCLCGHTGFTLTPPSKAIIFSFDGATTVNLVRKQCNARTCRSNMGYNFMFHGGRKFNAVCTRDLIDDVLFLNDKIGFTVPYLRFMASLQFRGFVSYSAFAWSARRTFDTQGKAFEGQTSYGEYTDQQFRLKLTAAVRYFLAMQEFELIDAHMWLPVEENLPADLVEKYDAYLHQFEFPPANPEEIKEVVGDGHEKVHVKCPGAARVHAGQPRKTKDKREKPYTHGWYMLTDPRSQRILAVTQMLFPENNEQTAHTLRKILPYYPNINCFIYDRACTFMPSASQNDFLSQIEYYICDVFHGNKHKPSCLCRSKSVRRLKRRLRGINTSIAEQTFAWFRGYARSFNEMQEANHRFFVLYFCKLHNTLVDDGDTGHLNPYVRQQVPRDSRTYTC
jgi:hypothetical protein